MKLLVVLLGCAILAIGVVGVASPHALHRAVGSWRSARRRVLHGLARIGVGALLGMVAPRTRAPEAMQVLAIVVAGSGLIALLIRPATFWALLSWSMRQSSTLIRAWSLASIALGGFLVWATWT